MIPLHNSNPDSSAHSSENGCHLSYNLDHQKLCSQKPPYFRLLRSTAITPFVKTPLPIAFFCLLLLQSFIYRTAYSSPFFRIAPLHEVSHESNRSSSVVSIHFQAATELDSEKIVVVFSDQTIETFIIENNNSQDSLAVQKDEVIKVPLRQPYHSSGNIESVSDIAITQAVFNHHQNALALATNTNHSVLCVLKNHQAGRDRTHCYDAVNDFGPSQQVEFSPDGRFLLFRYPDIAHGNDSPMHKIVSFKSSGRGVSAINVRFSGCSKAHDVTSHFAPDQSNHLYTLCGSDVFRRTIYNLRESGRTLSFNNHEITSSLDDDLKINSAAIMRGDLLLLDGSTIAQSNLTTPLTEQGYDRALYLWDLNRINTPDTNFGRSVLTPVIKEPFYHAVHPSQNIVVIQQHSELRVIEIVDQNTIRTIASYSHINQPIRNIVFDRNKSQFLAIYDQGIDIFYQLKSHQPNRTAQARWISLLDEPADNVALSDSGLIAVTTNDHIYLWSLRQLVDSSSFHEREFMTPESQNTELTSDTSEKAPAYLLKATDNLARQQKKLRKKSKRTINKLIKAASDQTHEIIYNQINAHASSELSFQNPSYTGQERK